MSEYRWLVKQALIGVQRNGVLIGVIKRSGICRALGHFCNVEVQVDGKKYFASDAEARIFPFHSIDLKDAKEPKLLLRALGWCNDGNTYAFVNERGEVVDCDNKPIEVRLLEPKKKPVVGWQTFKIRSGSDVQEFYAPDVESAFRQAHLRWPGSASLTCIDSVTP